MSYKKEEINKQGKNYLSEIYSEKRRPTTSYPMHLAKEIIRRSNLNGKLRLLDVGCGRGDLLKAFEELGHEVEGVDLSSESQKFLNPIKVYNQNLEEEKLVDRDSYYDIVISKSLIEHLRTPLKFVENCKDLIKDNGVFILMTPSWFHHKFGPFYLDYTHVTPFTLHSLRDIGLLAGFRKIDVRYFYQLPFTWKNKKLEIIPKLISFLRLPYMPMYEQLTKIKFPNKINTLIRFSREVMLYAELRK